MSLSLSESITRKFRDSETYTRVEAYGFLLYLCQYDLGKNVIGVVVSVDLRQSLYASTVRNEVSADALCLRTRENPGMNLT